MTAVRSFALHCIALLQLRRVNGKQLLDKDCFNDIRFGSAANFQFRRWRDLKLIVHYALAVGQTPTQSGYDAFARMIIHQP